MKRNLLFGLGAVALVVIGLLAFVFRTPQQASAPIEAIPIAQATTAPTQAAAPTTAPTTAPTKVTEPTVAPTKPAEPTTAPAVEPTTAPVSDGTEAVFQIASDESEARFRIDEVLRGSPTKVVGKTNQVAGQIAINTSDPSATRLGVIQVNARTIATDNDFRNRAIKNAILRTDEFEFVTFTPTSISGLPTSGKVGETYTFQVTGDLEVAGTTKPVTFDVTVTPVSEQRLEGTATTKIAYRDFNLTIPDSPAVDTVADEVTLELQFVAVPASS